MDVKRRVLLMKEYLQNHSDEKCPVATPELRKYLEGEGCKVTTETLRTDIQSLLDAGYRIKITEPKGMATTYAWLSRDWEEPELQILVDAVSSAQFISPERTGSLIRKILMLSGPSSRENLRPRILISERVKASGDEIMETVQVIHRAMRLDRKITFYYRRYVPVEKEKKGKIIWEKKRVRRLKNGKPIKHTVSPWYTVWSGSQYYLVGWSDRKNDTAVFRIDRMETPEVELNRIREKEPEDFNIRDYTDQVFGMYTGSKQNVTLRCRREILDQIVDKFGPEVKLENVQTESFDITVPVHVAGTFYGWVAQFAGEMKIIGPEHVAMGYVDHLQKAIDETVGAV